MGAKSGIYTKKMGANIVNIVMHKSKWELIQGLLQIKVNEN